MTRKNRPLKENPSVAVVDSPRIDKFSYHLFTASSICSQREIHLKHGLIWIDAFTDQKFGGNPCAVVFSADSLSDDQMRRIAKEMNLSETAFLVKSQKAQFGARYFTPAEEIPLAGHPTIASVRALIEAGQITVKKAHQYVSLELKAGVVGIDIFKETEGDYRIVMTQKKPAFLSTHDPKTISRIFSLTESDILPNCVIQTVSTGTPQLMVPVKNMDSLRKAVLDVEAYKGYKATSDFFSPHLFCINDINSKVSTFARHFGVPPDTSEDAFTGSATGGMGAYLWHYNLIPYPNFIAEQGHWLGRPGTATVEIAGSPDDIETVRVGGKSAVIFRGEIDL